MGDKPVVSTPGPAPRRLTTFAPEVHVTKWEEFVSSGRRWTLAIVGAAGASLILFDATRTGDWKTSLSAAGIVLDIAGAALLTTGLMLPTWRAKEMAMPRKAESKSVRTYWEQASLDAQVAFWLIVAGFALQGFAMMLR